MAQFSMPRSIDDVTFQGFYAWEVVSPRLNGWSLNCRASDTAIALGLQHVAVNRERIHGAAGNAGFGVLRRYLARWAYEGPSSQRNFWQFHELIHYYMGVPDWLEPVQQKRRKRVFAAPSDAADFTVRPGGSAVWAVSTRARDVIASSLLEIAYRLAGDEIITLEDIQGSLTSQLRLLATIKVAMVVPAPIAEAPSTSTWVHNFMLWTGKSPPVVVSHIKNVHTTIYIGDVGENSRRDSARYRRGHLDRRASNLNRQSHPSHRLPTACCSHARRRVDLRNPARSRQRPLWGGSVGEVGHHLRNDRQRA